MRKINVHRNNRLLPTNSFILTFDVPILPPSIKAGYLNIPVEPFIPIPCVASNIRGLGMDRTHVVANLSVPAVVFQTMIVIHAQMILFVPSARETTVHTRESVHGGNLKNRFNRLRYTTGSPFQKPQS